MTLLRSFRNRYRRVESRNERIWTAQSKERTKDSSRTTSRKGSGWTVHSCQDRETNLSRRSRRNTCYPRREASASADFDISPGSAWHAPFRDGTSFSLLTASSRRDRGPRATATPRCRLPVITLDRSVTQRYHVVGSHIALIPLAPMTVSRECCGIIVAVGKFCCYPTRKLTDRLQLPLFRVIFIVRSLFQDCFKAMSQ